MMRDAYASYEQYITVRHALQNLQISTDTLNSLIVLDKEATIAEDVCEALQSGGKKCAYSRWQDVAHRDERRVFAGILWPGTGPVSQSACSEVGGVERD